MATNRERVSDILDKCVFGSVDDAKRKVLERLSAVGLIAPDWSEDDAAVAARVRGAATTLGGALYIAALRAQSAQEATRVERERCATFAAAYVGREDNMFKAIRDGLPTPSARGDE